MRSNVAQLNDDYWNRTKVQFLFRVRTPKGVKLNVPGHTDYVRVPVYDHVYWATSDAKLADELMKNEGVYVE